MSDRVGLWWIRRDLRLSDNPTLAAALRFGAVIPLFILDSHLLAVSDRRTSFLLDGLNSLDRCLRSIGARLIVRKGNPLQTLRAIVKETEADAIFAEEDFTPYARRRDDAIRRVLPLELVSGQTVQHPHALASLQGKPYVLYSAYRAAWMARLPSELNGQPAPISIPMPDRPIASEPIPDAVVDPSFPAGEPETLSRLNLFCETGLEDYRAKRDNLAEMGTSALSPYFHLGMISARTAVAAATAAAARERITQFSKTIEKNGAQTWLDELIWREFYIQVMANFPRGIRTAFRPELADIKWRNNPADFDRWKEGQTGVPVVDAGMRQLKETGWMHNRARMITASYLVKDLLIDWRWGEAWFMKNLLDGDLAANNGGWQWVAGTGTDAAPYFRVFNPVLQGKKFDPNGGYVRRWVPELRGLPNELIHAPWLADKPIDDYPQHPIVDHGLARQRALDAYKQARHSLE